MTYNGESDNGYGYFALQQIICTVMPHQCGLEPLQSRTSITYIREP